jgi:SAM-dependent methyltransferase
MNLYSADYWRDTVEPALAAWKIASADKRTDMRLRPASRRLNLGCGPHYRKGGCNADTYRGGDVRPDVLLAGGALPFPDAYFERAYLGHVLEHVPSDDVPALLAEVRRVVAPGGPVLVVCPDVGLAVERYAFQPTDKNREHLWACAEGTGDGRPGERHLWNATAPRVLALVRGVFDDAEELPVEPQSLKGWPVMDFTGAQCAVLGRVPQ